MDIQELTTLLQQPETLRTEQTDALKTLVTNYPYFQPGRALYLKALKNIDSYKYNNTLKITAAYTTDRSILFDFITSTVFNQNEVSIEIKRNSEHLKAIEVNDVDDISTSKSATLDDVLKQQIAATEGVLDPFLFEEKQEEENDGIAAITKNEVENTTENNEIDDAFFDETPFLINKTEQNKETLEATELQNTTEAHSKLEEKLDIGKPLDFDRSETHSFAEWLKITRFEPIKRDTNTTEPDYLDLQNNNTDDDEEDTPSPLDDKLAIIDKFILENPKIKPVTDSPKPKIVKPPEMSDDNLMTETLARIYLEQKNYEKAIQSYRILSLKYPEKSSFFANQIKAVKELKAYNND